MINKATGIDAEIEVSDPLMNPLKQGLRGQKVRSSTNKRKSMYQPSETMQLTHNDVYSSINAENQELIEIKSKSILHKESEMVQEKEEGRNWNISVERIQGEITPMLHTTDRKEEYIIDSFHSQEVGGKFKEIEMKSEEHKEDILSPAN